MQRQVAPDRERAAPVQLSVLSPRGGGGVSLTRVLQKMSSMGDASMRGGENSATEQERSNREIDALVHKLSKVRAAALPAARGVAPAPPRRHC